MMKRVFQMLCVIAVVLSMVIGVSAAQTASGSVLRLETTEGSVTVVNGSGRTMTASDNMRLMNGYTIKTTAASYAYISLDDTKAVKLDGLTTCTVRQQGTKLELLVESGNIFFNVSAPLSSSETMNIRTSTMVTGVRGTSGTVWSDGATKGGVRLHSGTVEVTTIDNRGTDGETGEAGTDGTGVESTQTAVVTAGQEATSSRDSDGGSTALEVKDTNPEDYTGFELTAISNEEGLLDSILENEASPLTEEVVAEAETRLADEQATQTETETEATTQVEEATADDSTTDTDLSSSSTTTTSSGGSSSSGTTTTVTTATVSTYEELVAALEDSDIVTITIDGDFTVSETIDIPADVTVTVTGGLTVDAAITTASTITVASSGNLSVTGDISGTGTVIDVEDGGTLSVTGTVSTVGDTAVTLGDDTTLTYGSSSISAYSKDVVTTENHYTPTSTASGDVYYLSGYQSFDDTISGTETWDDVEIALGYYDEVTLSISVDMVATVDTNNDSTMDATTIESGKTLKVDANGTINAGDYKLIVEGTLTNAGTIQSTNPNTTLLSIESTGEVTNTGTLSNGVGSSTTASGSGSTVFNQGKLTLTGGTIHGHLAGVYNTADGGFIIDSGTVECTGSYSGITSCAIDNYGTLTFNGTFSTDGTATTGILVQAATATTVINDSNATDFKYVIDSSNYYITGTTDATIEGGETWADVETALLYYDEVTISNTVTMDDDYTINQNKKLIVSEAGILNTGSNTFTVGVGALTVNGTIRGTTSDTNSIISITDSSGTFTMNGGELSTSGDGTAVSVTGGTFEMNGGTVSTSGDGTAVSVTGGTFEMNGGTVSTSGEGNAVSVTGGTFEMNGGTVSTSYTGSTANCGNAVYQTGGTFEMNGGSITTSSTATNISAGNGAYISSGEFTLYDGSITTTGSRRGVYIASDATFNMEATDGGDGGTITTESASTGGDAVYLVSGGTFNLNAGSITGTSTCGANEVVSSAGTFTMSGGSVTTQSDSEAITLSDGTFNMTGGLLSSESEDSSVYGYALSCTSATCIISAIDQDATTATPTIRSKNKSAVAYNLTGYDVTTVADTDGYYYVTKSGT